MSVLRKFRLIEDAFYTRDRELIRFPVNCAVISVPVTKDAIRNFLRFNRHLVRIEDNGIHLEATEGRYIKVRMETRG